jgi:hypothetical protein
MGTAFSNSVIVGAADATPVTPSASAPIKAIHRDALRSICS